MFLKSTSSNTTSVRHVTRWKDWSWTHFIY